VTIEDLASKYIESAERVFTQIRIPNTVTQLDEEKIRSAVEHAKRYLEDAKYYRSKSKLETSLASIAYCEGLLDALKLLGIVEFSW